MVVVNIERLTPRCVEVRDLRTWCVDAADVDSALDGRREDRVQCRRWCLIRVGRRLRNSGVAVTIVEQRAAKPDERRVREAQIDGATRVDLIDFVAATRLARDGSFRRRKRIRRRSLEG